MPTKKGNELGSTQVRSLFELIVDRLVSVA